MKAVKMVLKIVGVLVGIIALVVVGIIGLRAYNAHKYPIMSAMSDNKDKAQYETNANIVSIEGDYLNGFHFIPQERTYPGTVVVHGGSEGSPSYEQAKSICEQGYEVLALYFWGQPNQKPTLANVPLEQFNEVTSWIEENIDQPRPITVVGTSKGAEYTALLAAHGFGMDNLVNYTPAQYSYSGLDFQSSDELPSFTLNGEPVPFASLRTIGGGTLMKFMWDSISGRPPQYRPMYEQAAERADDSARIDLSGFRGDALFFGGDQDGMWPGDEAAQALAAQSPEFEAHVHRGAGHVFSDQLGTMPNGWQIMFGGTAEAGAEAYRVSNEILYARLAEWHQRV